MKNLPGKRPLVPQSQPMFGEPCSSEIFALAYKYLHCPVPFMTPPLLRAAPLFCSDVNGDHLMDVMIGAYGSSHLSEGAAHIVYGTNTSAAYDLSFLDLGTTAGGGLDGDDGFTLSGVTVEIELYAKLVRSRSILHKRKPGYDSRSGERATMKAFASGETILCSASHLSLLISPSFPSSDLTSAFDRAPDTPALRKSARILFDLQPPLPPTPSSPPPHAVSALRYAREATIDPVHRKPAVVSRGCQWRRLQRCTRG